MDLASPILELLTRLWNCVSPRVAHVTELGNSLNSLRSATEELTEKREDLNRRMELALRQQQGRTKAQVEGWIRRTEELEKEVSEMLRRGEREVQRKCVCSRCPRNCHSSYKIAREVEKLLVRVKEAQEKGRFDDVVDELPLSLAVERPFGDTLGLDLVFQKAWRCLTDEKAGILGIYGLGGVGKTTLLTKINNEFIGRTDDILVIWVTVPKQAKVEDVQKAICNRLNLTDENWDRKNPDEKTTVVYNYLNRNKFLLLLDDLWEPLNLLKVGIPISKGQIIFTTRSELICRQMDAKVRMEVECLNTSEANALFNAKVGEETLNSHPEIPELAVNVAQKCGGLPLALIAVGRAMSGKKNPEEWRRAVEVLKKSPSVIQGMRSEVYHVLKFSYDNLEDERIKQCFLYTALFSAYCPSIPVKDLIDGLIAEKLIEEYDQVQNLALGIIDNLKSACLLETCGREDEKYCVKTHDVIRDMALWIAHKDGGKWDMSRAKEADVNLRTDAFIENFKKQLVKERMDSMLRNMRHTTPEI